MTITLTPDERDAIWQMIEAYAEAAYELAVAEERGMSNTKEECQDDKDAARSALRVVLGFED